MYCIPFSRVFNFFNTSSLVELFNSYNYRQAGSGLPSKANDGLEEKIVLYTLSYYIMSSALPYLLRTMLGKPNFHKKDDPAKQNYSRSRNDILYSL